MGELQNIGVPVRANVAEEVEIVGVEFIGGVVAAGDGEREGCFVLS